jgi:hypothetical protein
MDTNKKEILTTRHRIPNNSDLKQHLDSKPFKSQSNSLSSTLKLVSIKEELVAPKGGPSVQIQGITVTKPLLKSRQQQRSPPVVGVMSCMKKASQKMNQSS